MMKKFFYQTINPFPSPIAFNTGMLFIRLAASLEIAVVHGFKKIGIGASESDIIPNPFHLPEMLNSAFAIAANMIFPFFVIIGLFTRLATLPTLAVTLTGYFIVHWNDSLLLMDTPFIYSLLFLIILILGPGKYSLDNQIFKKHRE